MVHETDYKLRFYVKPQTNHAIEGEPFSVIFKIKNIGENDFPGMTISIASSWPLLGNNSTVYDDLEVGSLTSGELREFSLSVTPLLSGFTFFSIEFPESYRRMGSGTDSRAYHKYLKLGSSKVFMFLEDETRKITNNLVFGNIQAKSNEELLAKEEVDYARKALKWAIIAFAASVIFGLTDIILTILNNIGII